MKNIKDQGLFITYELCLKMHKLGFDWNGFDCYWEPDGEKLMFLATKKESS